MDRDTVDTALLWLRVAAGAASAIWGGLAPLVQVLLVMMVIDVMTGFLAGFIARALSSDVSLRGMAKKTMMLLGVAAASILGPPAGVPVLDDAVAGFFIAHEGLSIGENYARAGLPFPAILRDALAKLAPPTPTERRDDPPPALRGT